MTKVTIAPLSTEDLETIWQIGFRQENPLWTSYNAPYFEDYVACATFEDFLAEEKGLLNADKFWGIFVDDRAVGTVGRYWESEKTRWLEIGLVIYDETLWSAGIGYQALSLWITKCFADYLQIERVGLTSWSGNPGMMKLAEKLGMTQEACLRKVRYWQGVYYDSVKYGILREEWLG